MTAARRLVVGLGALAATASVVRQDRVGGCEVVAFRAVNDLPDGLAGPVWVAMQAGTAGAPVVAALVAWSSGRPRLAAHLLASGGASWVLAKRLKQVVRRPRPAFLLEGTRVRGREQTGLGFLSGHAAVVVALARSAAPHARGRSSLALAALVPAVGVGRVYVGAHLPLDVVAGAALGAVVETVVGLLLDGPP